MNTLRTWTKGLLPLAVVVLAACGDGGNVFIPPLGEDDVVFAASLGIDLATMERTILGVFIRDDVVGDGGLVTGSAQVTSTNTIWLPDGTQAQGPTPLQWITGVGAVPPGLDGGVIGMRVGGNRIIVIPPALGWGVDPPTGSGIPVNSWLVVRAEVTAVLTEADFARQSLR